MAISREISRIYILPFIESFIPNIVISIITTHSSIRARGSRSQASRNPSSTCYELKPSRHARCASLVPIEQRGRTTSGSLRSSHHGRGQLASRDTTIRSADSNATKTRVNPGGVKHVSYLSTLTLKCTTLCWEAVHMRKYL